MTTVDQALPAAAPHSPMPDLARPERRIAAFDGMRAIAVLLVMVGHANFFFQGAMGVDIFFVLSGYLITSILLDELAKTGHFSFRNFYMRRILRLYPALVLLVVLNLIATAFLHHRMDRAFGDSAIALVYVSNWTKAFGNRPSTLAHTWSLSIEEQFYLLWPAIALGVYWLLGRTRKAAIACLAAALAIVWYRHWMEARPLPHGDLPAFSKRRFDRIYFGLDTRGDDLLAGAMLAFWTPKLPRILAALVGWAGVLALLWFALLTPIYRRDGMHQILWGLNIPMPASATWGLHPYAYIWLSTVAILLGILNDRHGWLARALSLKPLAWVGVISYGLYLYHFPIVRQLTDWKWGRWQILALELPLTFLIAVISFYALERPCLKLKEHFRPGAKLPKGFPFTWRRDAAGN